MRIKSLSLKNFKRFTDLRVEDVPETAKLVLLIGANGAGKSSVFDAFYRVNGGPFDLDYYRKQAGIPYHFSLNLDGQDIDVSENTGNGYPYLQDGKPKFFGRTSDRIVPRLASRFDLSQIRADEDRPHRFIDPDTRVTNDLFAYMQSMSDALHDPIFRGIPADTVLIFQNFIAPLNESLHSIFGGTPDTTIQFVRYQGVGVINLPRMIFRKGGSEVNYDLLSHGEKQVIVLLLDFMVRQPHYENAIIFIDEMDTHLNTALQQNLLREIVTRWIPDSSQFWTASHALGFIDYARKSDRAAIIDFGSLDFDQPQVLRPLPKDNVEVYEIAIPKDMVATILADRKLVIVENQNSKLLNVALGAEGYLFLPANNSREVFLTIKDQPDRLGLRDRDFLRDDEVDAIRKAFPNLRILRYYTFENYLYHPDNLAEMGWDGFDPAAWAAEIIRQKTERREAIIDGLAEARQTYVEFKEGIKGLVDARDRTAIREALASDDFETFYPFFNMKTCNREFLARYAPQQAQLVQTTWFRDRMRDLLEA